MTSFLIIAKDQKKTEEFIHAFCENEHINSIDITTIDIESLEKKDKKKPALSIGINTIKYLQEKLYFKPIKSQKKICIIRDAESLTIEAQNAMLKFLEEPPEHTYIFLVSQTKETLLPTIVSRCQIITLEKTEIIPEADKKEMQHQIQTLRSLTIDGSLTIADSLSKNKDTATEWLEKMLLVLRDTMLEALNEHNKQELIWSFFAINQLQKTYQTLKTTNINVKLLFEHLFLTLVS